MRTIGILVGMLALGCGGGERGPVLASDGGASDSAVPSVSPLCAASTGAAHCSEGLLPLCSSERIVCGDGGWALEGPDDGPYLPQCADGVAFCEDDSEPRCVPRPDC